MARRAVADSDSPTLPPPHIDSTVGMKRWQRASTMMVREFGCTCTF
jgi:hypothetical protein